MTRARFGFNVFGLFTTPSGLGVAASNTVRVLDLLGVEYNCWDVDSAGVPHFMGAGQPVEGLAVNLLHLNPNWIDLMLRAPEHFEYDWRGRLNIAVPFWELPRVSASWISQLSLFDMVLAPTEFIRQALEDSGLKTPMLHLPQAVFLPEGVTPDRRRFGIPEDCTVFCTSFATGSLVARKNPWAAVAAFREAFPDEQRVRLVVRVHLQSPADDSVSRLRGLAANDSRMILVDEPLTYPEVLSLYASCDVYMSLHRSEGLGLGPMEAMSLGKATVATGWSGNMDFMDETDACLVEYELVPALLGEGTLYGADIERAGVLWAEPDVAAAARCMRTLHWDAASRLALGQRASAAMEVRRAMVARGTCVEQIRDFYEEIGVDSAAHLARAAALLRVESSARPGLGARFRRTAGVLARRLGLRRDSSNGEAGR